MGVAAVEMTELADAARAEFERLYRSHRDQMRAVALKLTGSLDRAEDLVSEAFARGFEHFGRFRGEASFATWLQRILMNLVYANAGRRAEAELPETLPGDSWREPAVRAEARAIAARIDRALAVLSPQQRQVFLLRELDGLKHAAIAERLGIAEPTAKVHYCLALKRLREELHDLV